MSATTLHNMSFVDYFAATVALGSVVTYGLQKIFSEVAQVKSKVDDQTYIVQDLDDKQEAADYLAKLNLVLGGLLDCLSQKFPKDERVELLRRRFDPRNVSEGSSKSGYTSYSVNKGEKIVVCIRQTDNKFVDLNDVLYVVIHELAHLATNEIGHTPTFWKNFSFLLQNAIDCGLYEYRNYQKKPTPYCGINLSSSILGDR